MNNTQFEALARKLTREIEKYISDDAGEWTVKGFIDIYKNVYSISGDTKVVSKLVEIMIFPIIANFATKNNLKLILSEHQNHYPDLTFKDDEGNYFAIDFKSTYRIDESKVNGFTLGAFTGYFRDRKSKKNATLPYGTYKGHFVLGIIYTRTQALDDPTKIFKIEELKSIASVVNSFTVFLQSKWKIASDKPGSGNTKNIGSVKSISSLLAGEGTFFKHGEAVFDDYWTNFLTRDMAKAIDSTVPYTNLKKYLEWRQSDPTQSFASVGTTEIPVADEE